MNSTPTGDPNNPGNAINDNITDNNFTTGVPNNLVLNANALLSYGFTYEKDITEQGNVMSLNYVPGNTAVYSADPMYGMIVQDNLVSGTNVIGASFTGAVYVVDSGANPITTPTIDGNLIVGSEASPGVSSVVVMGTMVSAFDNAVLGANLVSVATVSADNVAGTAIVGGNVASSGGIATGTPLAAKLSINSPPTLFVSECTQQSLSGLNISSGMSNDLINVTISAVFGSLSDLSDQGIASWSSDGIETITISGSMDQVNQELENINYESNTQGWDDSIEIQATDAYGFSATRFVPVIIETNGVQADDIQTLASQDFSSNGTLTYPGALTGGAIVASSGDSMIDMAGTISVVMLGSGDNTVIGGPNNGYISGGSGFNTLDLSGGGDITVAGGVGGLQVNATNGNDVIQPGAGGGTIDLGSGNSSVYGGLGQFTVTGGSGNVYLASLPEHSGNFSVSLGNGGGTIYALSGDDSIETQLDTSNVVYLGLGNSTVHSGGNDDIYTGAGNVTVDASGGGNDTVIGGTGSLFFIGGTGDTLIDPSGSTTVLGGSGNTTISGGQNVTVEIHFLAGTSRRLNLYASNPLVELSGYSTDPISSQYINNGTIFIGLSDGSDIMLPDLSQRMAIFDNGLLSLGEPGALNNEVIYNLDQNTGLEENMGPGALISSLIQNAPIGQNVLIVSTGLQCNGVISF
jgi:Ca2+-binding RTX toxin-like protein